VANGSGAGTALAIGAGLAEGYTANKEAQRQNDFNNSMLEWAMAYLNATPEPGRTGYSIAEKADVLEPGFLASSLADANIAGAKGQTDLAFQLGRSGTGDTGTGKLLSALGEAAPPIVAKTAASGKAYSLASSLARSQASAFSNAPIPAPAQPFDFGPLFGSLEAAYLGRGYGDTQAPVEPGTGYGHPIGPPE
jgi:hypothetical protein